MAITSSGGIGKEGVAVGWFSMLENVLNLYRFSVGNYEVLMGKDQGKPDKADVLVGVCYKPPNQDEEADEAFYK